MKSPRPVVAALVFSLLAAAWLGAGSPLAAAPQLEAGEPIDMDLEAAPLEQVLAAFAGILGAELRLDPALAGEVTVQLSSVDPMTALDTVCAAHGCAWTLLDGAPPLLRFFAADSPLAEAVSLELAGAEAAAVLYAFGRVVGATGITVDPALGGTLTLELREVPAAKALDAVCRALSCSWELRQDDGLHLRFTALPEAGGEGEKVVRLAADRPSAGRPPPAVGVRLRPPAGGVTSGTARFTWSQRSVTLRSAGGEWEAVLRWLPLAPGLDLLAPLLVQCSAGTTPRGGSAAGSRIFALDPLSLPLEEETARGAAGVLLELLPAADDEVPPQLPGAAAERCGAWPAQQVEVRYGGDGDARYHFTAAGPGDAILLVPPPTSQQPSTRAEVALVAQRWLTASGLELALLTPAPAAGARRQLLTLRPEVATQVTAELPGGRQLIFELKLSGPRSPG